MLGVLGFRVQGLDISFSASRCAQHLHYLVSEFNIRQHVTLNDIQILLHAGHGVADMGILAQRCA